MIQSVHIDLELKNSDYGGGGLNKGVSSYDEAMLGKHKPNLSVHYAGSMMLRYRHSER